jgi:hypothetical protein
VLEKFMLGAVTVIALTACSEDPEKAPVPSPYSAASLPGVYKGIFPCENCPGIFTSLWLRSDGSYFLKQDYLADEAAAGTIAYGLGRWQWNVDEDMLALDGAGPTRRFSRIDHNQLQMLTSSQLEHVLSRDTAMPEFDETLRIEGNAVIANRVGSLEICLAGLKTTLGAGRDYPRFARQYRDFTRSGVPVFIEAEGRFEWGADGQPAMFSIDKLLSFKQAEPC